MLLFQLSNLKQNCSTNPRNTLLIRVALTITTLLAMSTTTSSINSSLPPVAYTKVVNNISRGGIFKLLWSPEIDSKESIPPAYVAWRAGTKALSLLGS